MDVDFNESDGFTQSNISVEQATGEVLLDRPLITWQATNSGPMYDRTGACAVHLQSSNEILMMGGIIDLNPSQTGDETATDGVEIYDITNCQLGRGSSEHEFDSNVFWMHNGWR